MISTKLIVLVRWIWQHTPGWAREPARSIAYLWLRRVVGATVELAFGEIRFRVIYESISEYWNARMASRYEPEFLTQFIANLRKTNTPIVVYDIGASYGFYSLVAASYGRASKKQVGVVAFEPDPVSLERLEQNIELNGFDNVAIKPFPVGDAKGSPPTSVSSNVVSLDDFSKKNQVPPPSLIKIDIEGYELDALRGMKGILELHRPEILIEVHSEHLSDLGTSVEELVGFLRQLGYSKTSLHEKGKGASFGHQQEHMLFVPTKEKDGS